MNEQLVWRSPLSGELLLGGREMTHQRAIHACLTHSRNQIEESQTTATRITYRTYDGLLRSYEGTRSGLAQLIPNHRRPVDAVVGTERHSGPAGQGGLPLHVRDLRVGDVAVCP
jgi:hypothetical protein